MILVSEARFLERPLHINDHLLHGYFRRHQLAAGVCSLERAGPSHGLHFYTVHILYVLCVAEHINWSVLQQCDGSTIERS